MTIECLPIDKVSVVSVSPGKKKLHSVLGDGFAGLISFRILAMKGVDE